MRVAILSDIHSNLAALQAVLADAEEQRAEEIWCLGDTVGYGPDPVDCLSIVRERASLCLSGNHDFGAAGAISLDEFNWYAEAANRWTGEQLSPDDRDVLCAMPAMLTAGDVTLAHGSPREPVWEYVLSSSVAMASFGYFDTPVCFVGHSHVPLYCKEPFPGEGCELLGLPGEEGLDTGEQRLIVNPGSVGQPRDRDPRASYLILDRDDRLLFHRRVEYDIAETQRRMHRAELPVYLAERLSSGT